jgi:hypothetical protein
MPFILVQEAPQQTNKPNQVGKMMQRIKEATKLINQALNISSQIDKRNEAKFIFLVDAPRLQVPRKQSINIVSFVGTHYTR